MRAVMSEVSSIEEINTIGGDEGEDMWLTIDSGASENVIGSQQARHVPMVPSMGSRAGVQYTTADGTTMANRGEKNIKVITDEGGQCTLRMQVTDVTKPLMSVSRICDAGHEVKFDSKGGVIRDLRTGQGTKFVRTNNVYRLHAKAPFGRQG